MNQEEIIAHYETIYRAGVVHHPVRGRLEPYGSHANRDPFFLKFISRHLPPPARVIDASCGRGHLARSLLKAGYEVEVTEVSPWVVKNDLADLNVHLMTYDQIVDLPVGSFDAVCSNDVLEHLPGEEAVLRGLENLIRLSRRYVLISVGLGRGANKYPVALKLGIKDLHLWTPGARWWHKVIGKRAEIIEEISPPRTLFVFCKVRGEVST